MNRIVQSDEEDSKVARIKLGKINFPACGCEGRYYLLYESRAETYDREGYPCTMET